MYIKRDAAYFAMVAESDKFFKESGFTEETLARLSKVVKLNINSLPSRGTFSHFEYSINSEDSSMSHVRIYTDCGHSLSLSAFTRNCLYGDELKNPLFKASPDSSFNKGNAVLAGTKNISPELREWIHSNGWTSQRKVAMELIGKSFTSTPVEVANYYPENEEARIKKDEIDEINKPENINQRISKLKFDTLYRVVIE